MSLTYLLNQAVLKLDRGCARGQVRHFERGGLVTIFTHGLFLSDEEIAQDWCYPQQRTTVEHLRRMIVYFQSAGYRFVSPAELLEPERLETKARYALLAFDDGYFNNHRVLPLLQQYRVPAIFFVTAGLVRDGKPHWWDVLYRARRRQGVSVEDACREVRSREVATTEVIESRLAADLGVKEFKPASDTDRVFRPDELRAFAAHPEVFIGNHCWNHALLPTYSPAGARAEIARAQEALRDMTGKEPLAISYPSGAWTPEVLRFCDELGLKLGFSTVARKEYLPALRHPRRRMLLGRFGLWSSPGIEDQCEFMRSDLMWHQRYEELLNRIKQLAGRQAGTVMYRSHLDR